VRDSGVLGDADPLSRSVDLSSPPPRGQGDLPHALRMGERKTGDAR